MSKKILLCNPKAMAMGVAVADSDMPEFLLHWAYWQPAVGDSGPHSLGYSCPFLISMYCAVCIIANTYCRSVANSFEGFASRSPQWGVAR